MLLRSIYEDTNLTQMLAPIRETVSFKGIIIHVEGTNDTGQTLAVGNVGRIRYEKRGQTLVDMDYDYLNHINNVLGGLPRTDSATAGAVDFQIYIPRRFEDDNVETVVPSDNAIISCTFASAFDTALASATVRVYLDIEAGQQKYDLVMKQYTESISGSSTIPIVVEQDNMLLVCLSDNTPSTLTLSGSNISRVNVEVGSDSGNADLQSLVNNTQNQFNLESSFDNLAVLYGAAGDITSRLQDSVNLSVTTGGAATPEVGVISAMFDANRYRRTVEASKKRFDLVTQQKANVGKSATVAAINALAQA